MVALREIRRYQKSTKCLIKRSPFQKLIRKISLEYRVCPDGPGTPFIQVRFQFTAIAALQETAENFIVGLEVSWYSLEQYIWLYCRQAFNYCCSLLQV